MKPVDPLAPTAVIKIGGSLLGVPDLGARLANFLGDFSRPRSLVVCGGGEAVDALRRLDRVHNLGEELGHWLALRMLSVTARVVERVCPLLAVVDSPEDFAIVWSSGKVPVYDAFDFIIDVDDERLDPLPRRWRVTSDSIAARMAEHFRAAELVLLKSITLPERISIVEAASEGVVDAYFPTAARALDRVVAFNLREDEPRETLLVPE